MLIVKISLRDYCKILIYSRIGRILIVTRLLQSVRCNNRVTKLYLKRRACQYRACERCFVGILYFITYRHASCKLRYLHLRSRARHEPVDIEICGVGLNGCAGSEDNLVDTSLFNPLDKRGNLQRVGSYPSLLYTYDAADA